MYPRKPSTLCPCSLSPGFRTHRMPGKPELWFHTAIKYVFVRFSVVVSLSVVSLSVASLVPISLFLSPRVLLHIYAMQADVCGFWSFPRLSPRYRPPDRLVRFLARCEADNKPVFVVGLGSMPALGLVQVPAVHRVWSCPVVLYSWKFLSLSLGV